MPAYILQNSSSKILAEQHYLGHSITTFLPIGSDFRSLPNETTLEEYSTLCTHGTSARYKKCDCQEKDKCVQYLHPFPIYKSKETIPINIFTALVASAFSCRRLTIPCNGHPSSICQFSHPRMFATICKPIWPFFPPFLSSSTPSTPPTNLCARRISFNLYLTPHSVLQNLSEIICLFIEWNSLKLSWKQDIFQNKWTLTRLSQPFSNCINLNYVIHPKILLLSMLCLPPIFIYNLYVDKHKQNIFFPVYLNRTFICNTL